MRSSPKASGVYLAVSVTNNSQKQYRKLLYAVR
jgi:hypothetical protein